MLPFNSHAFSMMFWKRIFMSHSTTSHRILSTAFFLLILSSTSVGLAAQADVSTLTRGFSWREVGPANPAGRIIDVEAVEGSSHIIYAGAATGGLWKTVNAGITWEPIFDAQPTASIGDIGLSPSDPIVLYVGTGEANNRNSSPWGDGVYKSTDAGETWNYVGLRETRHIARVLVHPTDPDVVYVAAMGHLWATNEERGVFKTTDGGQNWDKIFYINERTGATDLAMDPANTEIIYVAAHERLRDRFDAGDPVDRWGPDAGIYVSRNGGADWTRSTEGLPTVDMGRLGIAAARTAPGTVYALIGTRPPPRDDSDEEDEEEPEEDPMNPDKDGIFKTTDYGATWVKVNDWNNRPSYYSQIRVDPNDENVIWGFASPMAYSDDGGITVKSGPEVQGPTHIDYHSAWIDPENSDHVIVGGDGGINVTWDRGKHWEVVKPFGLAQCYAISVDMRKPYYVVVGLQDNGVWVGASRGRITGGVTNADWFALSNADGFYSQVDPTDFNIIYATTQGGNIYRQDLRTGQRVGIRPSRPTVEGEEEPERYHFDWNAPFQLSPHNHQTLYMGGKMVFKSVNRGDDWEIVSPNLTADHEEQYAAIVSVAESPINAGLLWAGTNDGSVWVRESDTAEWTLVSDNIRGVPEHYWVKRIEASHHEPGRAYAVFDGHRWNDFAPYVYETDDFGQSWTNITNNLPEGSIYIIREDFKNPNLLFTGSEFAVFVSIDRGRSWSRFMNDMPTVPVHDLIIHPRDADLIAGTHGRGAWVVDNITPLQQLTDSIMDSDVHLFAVRPEVQWLSTYEFSWTTQKRFYADNPPTGSKIVYYLAREYSDSATVEILDITGKVVRTLAGSTDTGINTVFWDQREPPPPEEEVDSRRRRRGPRLGALLPPGEYLVRLTVGEKVRTTTLSIEEHVPGYMGR
jgi:photosystem II stability/assembly factor-like uncharacterized protein